MTLTGDLSRILDDLEALINKEPQVGTLLVKMFRATAEDPEMVDELAGYFEGLLGSSTVPRPRKAFIPPALRWRVWIRDDFRCVYCGDRYELSLDHVVPEVDGGPTTLENLVTACRDCNTRKGIRRASDFVMSRGYRS